MVRDLIVVASIAALASSLMTLGSGLFMLLFGFTALIALYCYCQSGLTTGYIYPASPSPLTYVILSVPSASLNTEQGLRMVATRAPTLATIS